MINKKILKGSAALGLLLATAWGIVSNNEPSGESRQIIEVNQDVKGTSNKLKDLTLDELRNANVPFESVEKSEIKISTSLENENIDHIKEETGKTAEKRPGGYLLTTYYETDIGEGTLVVSQGVNEFGDSSLQLEEAKNWYTGNKSAIPIIVNGRNGLLHENDSNFNTLHIFTDTEIYTFAGQPTDYLYEVAEKVLKDIK